MSPMSITSIAHMSLFKRSDNVIDEHHHHSPKCHFLRGLTCISTSNAVTMVVPRKTPSVQSRLELRIMPFLADFINH